MVKGREGGLFYEDISHQGGPLSWLQVKKIFSGLSKGENCNWAFEIALKQ